MDKTVATAVVAVLFSAISAFIISYGLRQGYGIEYALGALAIPFFLWIGTLHFYEEHRKESVHGVNRT